MSRKDRLNEVYEYVRSHYPVHTKNDFADKIKYHRTYVSSAMHGNDRYLTDKLFINICEAFPDTFNLDYLLTGNGQLLIVQEETKSEHIEKETNQQQPQYADKLIALLEKQIKDKDSQLADKDRIIKLLEQKIEMLEAMQHIDSDNPLLNYPFAIGAADQSDIKAQNVSPFKNQK